MTRRERARLGVLLRKWLDTDEPEALDRDQIGWLIYKIEAGG